MVKVISGQKHVKHFFINIVVLCKHIKKIFIATFIAYEKVILYVIVMQICVIFVKTALAKGNISFLPVAFLPGSCFLFSFRSHRNKVDPIVLLNSY